MSVSPDRNPTNLDLASTDDGSPGQQWRLLPVEGGPSDTFNITFMANDGITYLTWTDDSVLFGDGDSGTGEQRFQFIPTEDASYLIRAAPGWDEGALIYTSVVLLMALASTCFHRMTTLAVKGGSLLPTAAACLHPVRD